MSGKQSDAITLATGVNLITVFVTALNGVKKTYSIKITRSNEINTSIEAMASIDVNKQVMISGTASSGKNKQVSVRIIDTKNKTEYVNNTMTDENGKFKFNYKKAVKHPGKPLKRGSAPTSSKKLS